jgi:hypothetical protein
LLIIYTIKFIITQILHLPCRPKPPPPFLTSTPKPSPTVPKLPSSLQSTNSRKPNKNYFRPNIDKLSKKESSNPSLPVKRKRKKMSFLRKWSGNLLISKSNKSNSIKLKNKNKSKNFMNLISLSESPSLGSGKLSSPWISNINIRFMNRPKLKDKKIKIWSFSSKFVSFNSKKLIDKGWPSVKRKARNESRSSGSPGSFSSKKSGKKTLMNFKIRSQPKQSTSRSSLKARTILRTAEQE